MWEHCAPSAFRIRFCSTTKTYSYVPIITHKTGNTIQIVSQEVSASVHKAWRRK